MTVTFRDLTTLDEFAGVVALERRIWGPGYDEVVPVPILAVTVHRGGILIGAFDGELMVGFVYSLPAILDGRPTQWSHMLGVVDGFRNEGVGYELKLLQRERTIAMGLDLIEWTYDPMQAMNAHLNFTKLGVIAREYGENIYGPSSSPLHQGNPTDRFTAQWWIREPHVERRISSRRTQGFNHALALRTHEVGEAVPVNRAIGVGEWYECANVDIDAGARRLAVEIPMGFTEMLSRAPDLALAWRMATRRIFTTYFARGFRAVDFFLDREARKGAYLLARNDD
jgi:predicted GNAT superfamily acetyltransferase